VILKEFRPDDHIDIAGAYTNLGNVYRQLGEFEQSLEHHRLALAMYKRVGLPAVHPDMADCIQNLAFVHHDQGEFDVAQTLYQEALTIRRQCQLPTHPDIASNLNDIGYLLCDAERVDEGFGYFEQAYELRIANEGTSRIDLADSFNNMGIVNRHRGNLTSAIDFYTRALAIYEAALPASHDIISNTRKNLQLAQALDLSTKSNDEAI
jgi:tetratricopeptide (TPR) repeat protein